MQQNCSDRVLQIVLHLLLDIKTPAITLDEIFRYLEEADKPCLISIDEFQVIAKYPEGDVEAILRRCV